MLFAERMTVSFAPDTLVMNRSGRDFVAVAQELQTIVSIARHTVD